MKMDSTKKDRLWKLTAKLLLVAIVLIAVVVPPSSLYAQNTPAPPASPTVSEDGPSAREILQERLERSQREREARMQALTEAREKASENSKKGVFGTVPCGFGFEFACWGANATGWIRDASSLLTSMGAGAMNFSIKFSVIEMGKNVNDKISGVRESWAFVRDFANIFLIFTLLAIGIATILRVEGYGMRQLLAKLIIVAVLINFSYFFTRVVIDASNIVAYQFYQTINKDLAGKTAPGVTYGISTAFLEATRVIKTYGAGELNPKKLDYPLIIQNNLLATLLMLVAAVVFLAAAILLLVRFIVLIILMVLSPLAFVVYILPSTAPLARKWWSTLVNYSLFAPIFLALVLLSLRIITSEGYKTLFNTEDRGYFESSSAAAGDLLVVYILAIGFLVASLVISVKLGIAGGATAVKWGGSLRKFGQGVAGRNLISRPLRGTDSMTRAGAGWVARKTGLEGTKVSKWTGALYKGTVGRGFSAIEKKATYGSGKALYGATKQRRQEEVDSQKKEGEVKAREKTQATNAKLKQFASDRNETKIVETLKGLTNDEIKKIDTKLLAKRDIASELSASNLEAIHREGKLTNKQMEDIREANPDNPFFDTPSGGLWP